MNSGNTTSNYGNNKACNNRQEQKKDIFNLQILTISPTTVH